MVLQEAASVDLLDFTRHTSMQFPATRAEFPF